MKIQNNKQTPTKCLCTYPLLYQVGLEYAVHAKSCPKRGTRKIKVGRKKKFNSLIEMYK